MEIVFAILLGLFAFAQATYDKNNNNNNNDGEFFYSSLVLGRRDAVRLLNKLQRKQNAFSCQALM